MSDAGWARSTAVRRRPIRVLICDDHALFRRGLVMVLESEEGIEVVAEAEDGEDAVVKAEEAAPDVDPHGRAHAEDERHRGHPGDRRRRARRPRSSC